MAWWKAGPGLCFSPRKALIHQEPPKLPARLRDQADSDLSHNIRVVENISPGSIYGAIALLLVLTLPFATVPC